MLLEHPGRGHACGVRVVWTVGALLLGGYLGYVLAVVVMHLAGQSLSDDNLAAVAGPVAILAGVVSARWMWVRRSEPPQPR